MKIGDKFTLCVENNIYDCKIININNFREPSMKYAIDFYKNGTFIDTYFAGDEFFIRNENNILKEEQNWKKRDFLNQKFCLK